MMEVEWVEKRIELWKLLKNAPPLSDNKLARKVGMSRAWVQKWRPRLQNTLGDDFTLFMSRSRRRKTSPRKVTEALEAKIIDLREHLTEQYGRRVGSRNILYHLQQDPNLEKYVGFIPRCHNTVHDVLLRYNRIPRRQPRIHIPRDPAEPMQVWELDYGDIPTARSAETDKKQHQVEMLSLIDTGSSVALDTQVSDHFDAEWTLVALVDILQSTGLPRVIRMDRDPRLIASWSMKEFPSALMRFLLCLGITPDICPPRRPDLKPYVERFIRTQKEECIYKLKPATVAEAQKALNNFGVRYNLERPNQALTCGNKPPSIAIGKPPYLPRMPQIINPDAWLQHYHRHTFRRQINSNGSVQVDHENYYVGKALAGQRASLILDAEAKQFDIWVNNQMVKQKEIRGLFHGEIELDDYVDMMIEAARSEAKRLQQKQRVRRG